MSTIASYFIKMTLPAIMGALLWAISRPLRKRRLALQGRRAGSAREGALLLLFMFVCGLLWLTLTPPDLNYFLRTGQWLYTPGVPFQGGINLIPFAESLRLFQFYVKNEMWSAIWVNFPGNVIMFLPIGFFAGLLSDKPKWWKSTAITAFLSLFIECFQIFVARGTDVDDLILNTLGGILGHSLFLLLRRIDPGLVRRCQKV